MTDALAFSWLGRLLDLDPTAQAAQLQQLSTVDPGLHARLVRLLSAALAENNSLVIMQPALSGMRMLEHAATVTLTPGQLLAGYSLIRELGRGGMSVVWLAERADGAIRRQVALKLPLFLFSSPVETERFAREKDVLAELTHPHIARLYDAGVAEHGQPFIVLEFVDGFPITQWCDDHGLSMNARLQLFLQVLDAVDHAHKHLIVHRDLKPSNIMVDTRGEVKLLDFGIAKLLPDSTSGLEVTQLTQHDGRALTPLYAAPELLNGQKVSILTDIFALGVVLQELLAGTAYPGNAGSAPSVMQVLEMLGQGNRVQASETAIDGEVARKRGLPNAKRLKSALAGDLDTIIHKATRHVPVERYGSIEHFAEDVRRFLADRPIAARRPGLSYSARLFFRRHRGASLSVGAGVLGALIALVVAANQYAQSREQEARATAVRKFMFDVVSDAEPDEMHPDQPVTGKQMVDSAVERVHRDLRARPRLEGELLSELGRLYLRFDEPALANQALSEALSLLLANAPSGDAALNKTRIYIARLLYDEGEAPRARALAATALAACSGRDVECGKARAYADLILSEAERMQGNADASLSFMRNAVTESSQAFGEGDTETVMMLTNFAITARNAGRLLEASRAIDRAVSLSAGKTLRARDRLEVSRSKAILDSDLGHYAAARARLVELSSQPVSGADRALLLRLLSVVAFAQGAVREASDIATTAIELADAQKIPEEATLGLQAHARALAALGETKEALTEIESVIQRFLADGSTEESPEVQRARRIRAEILLRSGDAQASRLELESQLSRVTAQSSPSGLEIGQMADLLGCALRELHQVAGSLAAHERARAQFAKQLPPDHPFLARNSLYRYAAMNDRERFSKQATLIESSLPAESIWRTLIDAYGNPAVCPGAGHAGCMLVLY